MIANEANAAEKTMPRGCRMAINAAIKNVLSPSSEIIIIKNDKTNACAGVEASPLGPSVSDPSKSNIE